MFSSGSCFMQSDLYAFCPLPGGKTEQQLTPTSTTLTATGVASVNAATLTLTPAQPSKAGSVFLAARVPLFSYQLIGDTCGRQLAFSSSFSFTLTRPAASGSEGFAFVVAFDATPPTTPVAGGMGYAGMGARSVAVEFDTSMDAGNSDPDSNHVGINTGGNVTSVVTAKPSTPLNDGKSKHVWIEYDPSSDGSLRVFLSSKASPRPTTPLLSARISLCEELAPSPSEYTFAIGFTGASAAQPQSHVVSAWTLSTCDCWAYAVVGSVEAALSILANTSAAPVLSVEQLKAAMKVGCSGSTPSQAFQLLLKLARKGGGLVPEGQWPAEKGKTPVKAGSSSPLCAPLMKPLAKLFGVACGKGSGSVRQLAGGFPISGFESTSFYGWFGLLLAVQRQPVVVHIEASTDWFKSYDGVRRVVCCLVMGGGEKCAVLEQDPGCFTYNLNHVVLLVGYRLVGKDSRFPHMAPPFWIIRNSWGADWGDGGHMRMDIQGGDGVCGINSLPGLYPVVREDACKAAQRNPCAVGQCVNDGAGSYSCVCPPGFRQGTTVDGTFSCAPGDTNTTYTVLSPNVRCSDVFPVYGLTLAQFQAQNVRLLHPHLITSYPIPPSTVLKVASPASLIPCSVFYTTQQVPTSHLSSCPLPANAPSFPSSSNMLIFLIFRTYVLVWPPMASTPFPDLRFSIRFTSLPSLKKALTVSDSVYPCASLPPPSPFNLSPPFARRPHNFSFSSFPCSHLPLFPSSSGRHLCSPGAILQSALVLPICHLHGHLPGAQPQLGLQRQRRAAAARAGGVCECMSYQVGLIPVCSQYYLVQSAETCESIRNVPYPPLSPVDFFRLNPGIKCNRLIPKTDVDGFTGFEVRV
ncbi:unnamed protein product [Closterium sp. Naga37s-1]|nr:unnamed protein product [Closterium sp. Naga37s-1]